MHTEYGPSTMHLIYDFYKFFRFSETFSGLLRHTKLKEGDVFAAETKLMLSLILANEGGSEVSVEK